MWRQGVELIRGHLSDWREGQAHGRIIAGVDYHFVSKMPDVLDRVAHSGVVVEGYSRQLSRELSLQDLYGEGDRRLRQLKVLIGYWLQLNLLDPSLNQLVEDPEMSGDSSISSSLSDCVGVWVFWSSDLGLELFVELPQCLLFMDGILLVEGRLLPITT